MSAIIYHKLVRDRIPEIIEASGKSCRTEILSQENYLSMLDRKLDEELAEYQESKSMEELADLLEVIRAVALARGEFHGGSGKKPPGEKGEARRI